MVYVMMYAVLAIITTPNHIYADLVRLDLILGTGGIFIQHASYVHQANIAIQGLRYVPIAPLGHIHHQRAVPHAQNANLGHIQMKRGQYIVKHVMTDITKMNLAQQVVKHVQNTTQMGTISVSLHVTGIAHPKIHVIKKRAMQILMKQDHTYGLLIVIIQTKLILLKMPRNGAFF